jgi:hypothetical protein
MKLTEVTSCACPDGQPLREHAADTIADAEPPEEQTMLVTLDMKCMTFSASINLQNSLLFSTPGARE